MAKPIELPKELTEADWKKHKGVLAKILNNDTGIGDAMRTVAEKFGKINWSRFNSAQYPDPKIHTTSRDVDTVMQQAAVEHRNTVEPTRAELVKLHNLAHETAAAWKRNKAIPAASTQRAELVASSAEKLNNMLDDKTGAYFKAFIDACEGYRRMLEVSAERMKKNERPTDFNYDWFAARKPTVGFAESPKLKTAMGFLNAQYLVLQRNKYPVGSVERINNLRQMFAGLNGTEKALKETKAACKPGQHDNTKAAIDHYLDLLQIARQVRMDWLKAEAKFAKTSPPSLKSLNELIIQPGLMRA